jgi:hypothetical protein
MRRGARSPVRDDPDLTSRRRSPCLELKWALISAALSPAGRFSGSLAARRANVFTVLISRNCGWAGAGIRGSELLLPPEDLAWGLGQAVGRAGLAAMYRAMAGGGSVVVHHRRLAGRARLVCRLTEGRRAARHCSALPWGSRLWLVQPQVSIARRAKPAIMTGFGDSSS